MALPTSYEEDSVRRVRLTVKIALMYRQRGMSQAEVARSLGLSQARVSQLLKSAKEQRIVETAVRVPQGMFSDVEYEMEHAYGLQEAVVVDAAPAREELKHALGVGAAPFIRLALGKRPRDRGRGLERDAAGGGRGDEAAVARARPIRGERVRRVWPVRLAGVHATDRTAGRPLRRPRRGPPRGPGVVADARLRDVLWREPQVQEVVSFYDQLSVLLVGIGALPATRESGHLSYMREEHQAGLTAKGAVGDICLHAFDAEGRPVRSSIDDRLLGIGLRQMRRVPQVVAVAGGRDKVDAIEAALRGRWVHSLVTDLGTARELVRRRS